MIVSVLSQRDREKERKREELDNTSAGLLNCCAVAAVWVGILGSTVCLSIGMAVYSFTEYHKLNSNGGVQDDIFLTSTERIIASITSNKYVWLSLCIFFSFLAGENIKYNSYKTNDKVLNMSMERPIKHNAKLNSWGDC